MKNVLILCTGNSARSILGEALIDHLGKGRVAAYSAGSFPKRQVHPGALAVLARNGIDAKNAASKSWDVFTSADAPALDIVITVCDNAAGEVCPIFPGRQIKAHWGIADPADAASGDEEIAAFDRAFAEMKARIDAMLALDLESLTDTDLQQALNAIGMMDGATRG